MGRQEGQDVSQQRSHPGVHRNACDCFSEELWTDSRSEFRCQLEKLYSGTEVSMKHLTDNPSVLFPGQTNELFGYVGQKTYKEILTGDKVLELEITLSYDTPTEHVKYCDKVRWEPSTSSFILLGPMCSH